jgi:hypothetical protein
MWPIVHADCVSREESGVKPPHSKTPNACRHVQNLAWTKKGEKEEPRRSAMRPRGCAANKR